MSRPVRLLSLPSLNQDLDLDSIDSELNWLQKRHDFICGACGLKLPTSLEMKRHLTIHSKDVSRKNTRLDHWLRLYNLPLTSEEVLHVSFDQLVGKYNLTAEDLVLCKDIRRRGQNRISAARSRQKRKALIFQLKNDLKQLKNTRKELMQKQLLLLLELTKWKSDILSTQNHILHKLGFDSTQWQLKADPTSGEIHVFMKKNYQFILSKV